MNKIANLRSAKYLVRRYEKFLKMDIPIQGDFLFTLSDYTGFRTDCMLCKEVINKNDFALFCDTCIWSLAEKSDDFGNHKCHCINDNYVSITCEPTNEEGKKLLTERIAMLKELIKKAESKNIPINPPKSH